MTFHTFTGDSVFGVIGIDGNWTICTSAPDEWVDVLTTIDLWMTDRDSIPLSQYINRQHHFDFYTTQEVVDNLPRIRKMNYHADLTIVIDCDRKLFISSYYELALEDQVPSSWKGEFIEQVNLYVPVDIARLWGQ